MYLATMISNSQDQQVMVTRTRYEGRDVFAVWRLDAHAITDVHENVGIAHRHESELTEVRVRSKVLESMKL